MKFMSARSSLYLPALILIFIAAGCATAPSPHGLRTERQSSGPVRIESVRLRPTSNGVMVYGCVRQGFGLSAPLHSHLDLQVLGPSRELLHEYPVDYSPRPISRGVRIRGHSDYALELAHPPPPGSTVRVLHHSGARETCPAFQKPPREHSKS